MFKIPSFQSIYLLLFSKVEEETAENYDHGDGSS